MSDDLLPYYNQELAALRTLATEFAEEHPKIAGRIGLGKGTVEDPHVSRLIESVAFLNARVRHKLDDDFPELTEALLDILYPHYLAPIPSLSLVQFTCDAELSGSYVVQPGTMLETDRVHGEPCFFRTVYPVEAWPVLVESAEIRGAPFTAPEVPGARTCAGLLHLVLKTALPSIKFGDLQPESLRFHLRGQGGRAYDLYELLVNDVAAIAVASGPSDPNPSLLPAKALQPVGFGLDEGLLPYSRRSLLGYRLLTDYFALPEKYLFCDLTGLPQRADLGSRLHVFIYLKRVTDDLEQSVSAESFALGCTPIVNLFQKRCEPIEVDQTRSGYHLVVDARRPLSAEVYSLDTVNLTRGNGAALQVLPMFGVRPIQGRVTEADAYWCISRRPTLLADGRPRGGQEVALSLVDPDLKAASIADGVMSVRATCFNREMPQNLPFGGGQPRLRFSEGGGPISRIQCLLRPTKVVRPSKTDGAMWRLISHLSLNHLSLVGGSEATRAFKELLRLYDVTGRPENRNAIDGILKIEALPKVLRVMVDGNPGVVRGMEIAVQFDERRYSGSGLFLFASVMERFLASYSALNTFTQMVATSTTREGEVCRWPPHAGDRPLL